MPMKTVKRTAALLAVAIMILPCFSIISRAANSISFDSPRAAVGQEITVKATLTADSDIEDRTVVMTYDTTRLKFKSGADITETAPGELTYKATGEVGGKTATFEITFDALAEGSAVISVKSYTVWNTSDERLTCGLGQATVTVTAEGEESDDDTVGSGDNVFEVNGERYTISNDFNANEMPAGFAESKLELDGAEYRTAKQEATGLQVAYLVDGEGKGAFFLFVDDNGTFAPFEQVTISDITVITILSYVENVKVPSGFRKTNVEINGSSFPAWQSRDDEDQCLIYAMNNHGRKSLYRYDLNEATFQRFSSGESGNTQVAAAQTSYAPIVVLLGFLLVIFAILTLVFGVKLHNRNAELDEIYDEVGIDLFDDDGDKKRKADLDLIDSDEEEDVSDESEDDDGYGDLELVNLDIDDIMAEEDVASNDGSDESANADHASQGFADTPRDIEKASDAGESADTKGSFREDEAKARPFENADEGLKELEVEVRSDASRQDERNGEDFNPNEIRLD